MDNTNGGTHQQFFIKVLELLNSPTIESTKELEKIVEQQKSARNALLQTKKTLPTANGTNINVNGLKRARSDSNPAPPNASLQSKASLIQPVQKKAKVIPQPVVKKVEST